MTAPSLTGRRILVCGGTGVLGRALVAALVSRGHHVRVLARTEARSAEIAAAGGVPVSGDMLGRDTLLRAADGQEVVIHAATSLPRTFPGKPSDFAANDRIRRDGTRNLLEAAARAGATRVVVQSIVWVHGDQNGAWIDEEATLRPGVVARSAVDMEAMARESAAHHGFALDILRCSGLYAADAFHTREILHRLKHRTAPVIGEGANYQCFVHVADTAHAFVLAAESSAPGDTYFVTDDEPVRLGEYLRWLAQASGAPAPLHIPEFVARLAIGPEMTSAYGASLRCRNDRIKRQLGWAPRYPTFRDGYAEILKGLGVRG